MILDLTVEGFEGTIKLDTGKYRDRVRDFASLGVKADEEGKIEFDSSNQLDTFVKFCDLIHKKVLFCELKHIETGKVFNSLDELEDYQEYDQVINVLIAKYNEGGRLSKKQKQQLNNK